MSSQQQVQVQSRKLGQRVRTTPDKHEVVLFPGVTRAPVPAKKEAPIPAEQRRMVQLGFQTYQTGTSLKVIAENLAELDAAIRNPENEKLYKVDEEDTGSTVKGVALTAYANAYRNLAYIAQDLANKDKHEAANELKAVLANSKADRERPVDIQQQQRPDPNRQEKDRQAGQQQPQL